MASAGSAEHAAAEHAAAEHAAAEHAAAQAGQGAAGLEPDFSGIFEALPGSFLVLSPDLVIMAADAAYRRDSRATRDALIGWPGYPARVAGPGQDQPRGGHDRVRRYDLGPIGAEPDTRYWIELPAPEPMAVAQLAIRRDEIVRSRAYSGPRTVLYVEDMGQNLRLVEQIPSQWPSVTVLAAMLGGVALDLAGQHRPDVILLDLNLPDMTGEAVLAELRANPAACDIPVVILSADATERRADQARFEGIQAYLTKPIDVQGLLQALDSILDETPGPAAAPAAEAAMTWRSVPPSRPAR